MTNITEAIYKLEDYTRQLNNKVENSVRYLSTDDENKVREIANKTIETINSSIDKLKDLANSDIDPIQLENFLIRLDSKCVEIVKFTENKIDEFKPNVEDSLNDFINKLDDNQEEIKLEFTEDKSKPEFKFEDTVNKILENPYAKNATELLKQGAQKASEFYHADETQVFINKMKLKRIEVAEKGLEGLKILLDRVEESNKSQD